MNIVDLREIPDKIPLLAKWHHHQWSFLNPNSNLETRLEKMQLYLSEDFMPSTYVALDNKGVIGSAAIVRHDMDTRLEYFPWLASVFVAPACRNNGVGSKLVKHIMHLAEKNEITKLYLFTPDKQNFYKRLGWSIIHDEPYNNVQVSVMQWLTAS